MLRSLKSIKNVTGPTGAHHLCNTFLATWAINAARRARKTVAIGATAIAPRVLRKLSAGLGANALKVRGRVFAQINVTGE
jgi:hypothetical protein